MRSARTSKKILRRPFRPTVSLADQATERIRDGILDMTYEPGSRLNEAELVSSLGLGRTPIREALNRIAAEGLIEFEVNKGPIVRPLDIAEVDQLFESYRVAGQIAAAYCRFEDPGLKEDVLNMQERHRAAIKAKRPLDVSYWNYAFHTRIAVSSGNEHLASFCRRANNHARRINTLFYRLESALPTYPDTQLEIARTMHCVLVKAIERNSHSELASALDDQSKTFRIRFARCLERAPDDQLNRLCARLHLAPSGVLST
jgi:DNA-binding GntR family transcriptional regulator